VDLRGFDAAVPMLVVVPREGYLAVASRLVEAAVKVDGKAQPIFQRLKVRLDEGVVVRCARATERPLDHEVSEQLPKRLAGHGRPPVGMDGE
jgi:hypothetical protein